ncbi:type II toxin-antitoxin system VapC family toxin [Parvibaculum sp.]|uniref:type II toxin-antitoxin system VapC family toxin n=1 Tax=Parvibaculum sp. TaxID=2024848 RepID=UPI002FDAB943
MTGPWLLDTNIVSETRKRRPAPGVMSFLDGATSSSLFISVLTIGELRKGVETKRQDDAALAGELGRWVDGLETLFADRILPVDTPVAHLWGALSAGRSLPVIDTLIAATALVHGLTVVTQNGADMEATGVSLLNPWER